VRAIFLVSILFVSLMASDAKIKYEKALFNIEKHYFKHFSRDELITKSIDNLLQSTPYLTKSENKKTKQELYRARSANVKLEILLEILLKKALPKDEIYEMLISSCMDSLDIYSRYLNYEQMQELKIKTEGVFVGIGINLNKINNSLMVQNVLKNSPASKADIKVSDRILEIDDVACDGISLEEAIELLRKDVGKIVRLSIKRESRLIEVELKIETIKVENLEFKRLKEGILYFKISSFEANIAQMVSDKIKEHQKSSRAIILDLRGNPGGLVSQAVEVADMFLNRGNIITQVGRGVSDKKSYDASKEKTLTSLPLAVLVDSNTASSAEILSGALQIHHRATLFGEKTFGKGSVESLYALNKEEALSLTVAHYFLADSSTIEGVGILPDYEVNTQIIGGRDKCLASAEEFLQNIKKFIKKNPPQISGVCTKEGK